LPCSRYLSSYSLSIRINMQILLCHSYLYAVVYSGYRAPNDWMINEWWIWKFLERNTHGQSNYCRWSNTEIYETSLDSVNNNLMWLGCDPKNFLRHYANISDIITLRFGRKRVAAIATRYTLNGSGIEYRVRGEIFRIRQDRPWGPPSLLHNGHRVFPGCKAVGAWRWSPKPI
jgi:hypothetical protein